MYRTQRPDPRPRAAQAGAALVIALIMLLILTILALAGVSTATTELTMAGNDQFRHSAMQAAAAGIEAALPQIGTVGTARDNVVTLARDELVPGSTDDRYSARARYIGEENGLPQSSADKFIGLHYVVDSTGTSARNARDEQSQGVMVIAPAGGGATTVGRLGEGLP